MDTNETSPFQAYYDYNEQLTAEFNRIVDTFPSQDPFATLEADIAASLADITNLIAQSRAALAGEEPAEPDAQATELPMELRKTQIVASRAFTLLIHAPGNADVYWQYVNPATGRPWQAKRGGMHFEGVYASLQALNAWNRYIRIYKDERP